ncbi:MAG: M15 family metallopeptidase [Xanthobacteraceae bacterium]
MSIPSPRLAAMSLVAFHFWAAPLYAQIPAQTGASAADAVAPVTQARCSHMKQHRVMNPGAPVGCERLRLLTFSFVGFDDQVHRDAEMVVMDAVAEHALKLFVALRARRFPIAAVQLMDQYNGDDDAAIAANNTSSLNVRQVAGGGGISLHAYGVAIDVNPVQNPYVARFAGRVKVAPPAGARFLNRKDVRPGMAESVTDVFAEHGFVEWGGAWHQPDYQHFQVGRPLAYRLAALPPAQASALFDRFAERARACIEVSRARGEGTRRSCVPAN